MYEEEILWEMAEVQVQGLRGGEFLLRQEDAQTLFTPEDWTEEHRLVYQTARDFLEKEVYPVLDDLDAHKEGLMPQLLDKAGELGLLGFTVPEEYGGSGADFQAGAILAEALGPGHSFAVSFFAHTGIGTLPIQYFGTDAQRRKYLPDLASGKRKSAYCLTEPNAGSDALSIRTSARLNDAGTHYILNGQKMFITNAGFADLFIVFAKVDGEHFTAFIVEKDFGGITIGPEEKKMGIKGASTCPVFLEDVPVPKENVLGEIGKGHHIAFGILNVGRFKLGAACLGSAKRALAYAAQYAKERVQFGKPIAEFGAIQWKISQMGVLIFGLESLIYRVATWIQRYEEGLRQSGKMAEASMLASREYAIETAITKVAGSEVLDFVVDETLQIYGGYGYIEEYPAARMYRDSRINRIFEGTNEINRLLMVSMVARKAMKGELDLMRAINEAQQALTEITVPEPGGAPLSEEGRQIQNAKRLIHLLAGAAFQKYMDRLEEQQEIIMGLADMMIQVAVAESAWLRAQKHGGSYPLMVPLVQVLTREALGVVAHRAQEIVMNIAEGDELRLLQGAVRRWTRLSAVPTFQLRRQIARHFLERNGYVLQ